MNRAIRLFMLLIIVLAPISAKAQQVAGCYFADNYGADPTGASASDGAISTIKTLIGPIRDVCIQFGTGNYIFANRITITLSGTGNSVTLKGAGASVTKLLWQNSNGGILVATAGNNLVNISGFRLSTFVTNGGNAITLTNSICVNDSPTVVDDVFAVGSDFPYSSNNYWTYGVKIERRSFVNVRNLTVRGSDTRAGHGIGFEGAAGCKAVVLNVAQSQFLLTDIGLLYGANAEGVTVTQSNFTNGNVGITDIAGTIGQSQLSVSDSQFDVELDAIRLMSVLQDVSIHYNAFNIPANHSGIVVNSFNGTAGGSGYSFIGNKFQPASPGVGNGIAVFSNAPCGGSAPCGFGVISGNYFNQLVWGVVLSSAQTQGWNVQSNIYNGSVNNVGNSGLFNTIGGGSW